MPFAANHEFDISCNIPPNVFCFNGLDSCSMANSTYYFHWNHCLSATLPYPSCCLSRQLNPALAGVPLLSGGDGFHRRVRCVKPDVFFLPCPGIYFPNRDDASRTIPITAQMGLFFNCRARPIGGFNHGKPWCE